LKKEPDWQKVIEKKMSSTKVRVPGREGCGF
jgi:hypothetical protein